MAHSVDALKLTIRRLLTEDSTPDDVVEVPQDSRRRGQSTTSKYHRTPDDVVDVLLRL